MPSLANFSANKPIKGLYVGDPGAGKTGSLESLVAAGFKLRIWDFDNLLEPLFQYVMKNCPDKAGNVAFQTFTDKIKAPEQLVAMIGGDMRVMPVNDGTPTAFPKALKMLDHWKTPDEDLGKPREWGTDTICVFDTLTQIARAAYRYCQAMNPMAKDGRTHYGAAQAMLTNLLADLFSDQFHPHVLMLAHIEYDKNHLEIMKGFPRSIGSAMQTQIGGYFNSIFLAESLGGGKRVIRTQSTGIVDLKNPIPFKVPAELPLETGLATIFKSLR